MLLLLLVEILLKLRCRDQLCPPMQLFLLLELRWNLRPRRVVHAWIQSSHLLLTWALFGGNSVNVDASDEFFVEDLIRLKNIAQARSEKTRLLILTS